MDKKPTSAPEGKADFSQNPPTGTKELDTNVESEARKSGTNPDEWQSKEGA